MNEDQEIKIGLTCSDDANNSGIPNSSGWDGTGLPPVGTICEILEPNDDWFEVEIAAYCKDSVGDDVVFYRNYNSKTSEKDYDWCYAVSVKFRKPETQEQRNERERLEAAYDLCREYEPSFEFDSLEELKTYHPTVFGKWLKIVDKTNYRLTK